MAYGASQSQTPIFPTSPETLHFKSKLGYKMEIPGIFYNQYVPTAATITSGTVTNSGQSLIGALQLGGTTAGTLPLGGTAAVTFSSSSGLLCSFTTSSFMPTTAEYDQFPVTFTTSAAGVLPTGLTAGTVYYWQWASATTGRLAATPNGASIAYTDGGTATIYIQAASASVGYGYYGSPWMPAGFLQSSEGIATSSGFSGCTIHVDIIGHKVGTGTNTYTITPGLYSSAGTWTALMSKTALAAVNAGPFPFYWSEDIQIQQYGTTSAPIAIIRTSALLSTFSASLTQTYSSDIVTKTVSLDATAAYAIDVRYIASTPVVGEYVAPLMVRMWAYN